MRFASQWASYKWNDFLKLDGEEQDEIVATYQARMKIEAINAYEASKRLKKK
jgi:hypothetical protein